MAAECWVARCNGQSTADVVLTASGGGLIGDPPAGRIDFGGIQRFCEAPSSSEPVLSEVLCRVTPVLTP